MKKVGRLVRGHYSATANGNDYNGADQLSGTPKGARGQPFFSKSDKNLTSFIK